MLSGFLNPISPWLIIILPLLALPLKIISYQREKLRNTLALIVPIITTIFVFRYYPMISKGDVLQETIFNMNNI